MNTFQFINKEEFCANNLYLNERKIKNNRYFMRR